MALTHFPEQIKENEQKFDNERSTASWIKMRD